MATLIETRVTLNKFEIVRYQILHYLFINNLRLGEGELNCLTFLGVCGKIRLTEYCILAVEKGYMGHTVAVNNVLTKLHDKKLLVKEGGGKKIIFIAPSLKIQAEGNILINIKLVKLEGKEVAGNIQAHSREAELA